MPAAKSTYSLRNLIISLWLCYFPIFITVGIGIVLSVTVWMALRSYHQHYTAEQFTKDTEDRILIIERTLEYRLNTLHALSAFFRSNESTGRAEFSRFSAVFLNQPGLEALEWLPYVPATQCAAHEQAVRAEIPDYHILRLEQPSPASQADSVASASSQCTTEPASSEFFPVLYFESRQARRETVLGLDLGSAPEVLAALHRARDSGDLQLIPHLDIGAEETAQYGMFAIYPVYNPAHPATSKQERRVALQGFVVAILNLGEIIHSAVSHLRWRAIDLRIYYLHSGQKAFLYFYPAAEEFPDTSPSAQFIAEQPLVVPTSNLQSVHHMHFVNQNWEIIATPGPGYPVLNGREGWSVLLSGLLITTLLAGYFYGEMHRAYYRFRESEREKVEERLRSLVQERTRDLLAAKENAEEASRTQSRFLANMSHELRTPLNAILGYSELLHEEAEDLGVDSMLSDLRKIHSAGHYLLSLISDILDLSKIKAGKIELLLEECEIPWLLQEVQSIVAPLMEKNHNHFRIDYDPNLTTIHVDVTRMRQILFNLLSNASKFTRNGHVVLSVHQEIKKDRHWSCYSVRDTGIGMTTEHMERLFQEFHQAEANTVKEFGGTGLGLAISRHFTNMMGGDISVTSEYGKGSIFIARVPTRVEIEVEQTEQ